MSIVTCMCMFVYCSYCIEQYIARRREGAYELQEDLEDGEEGAPGVEVVPLAAVAAQHVAGVWGTSGQGLPELKVVVAQRIAGQFFKVAGRGDVAEGPRALGFRPYNPLPAPSLPLVA